MSAEFQLAKTCWVCGSSARKELFRTRLDFSPYVTQAPALAAYTGQEFAVVRCRVCDFAQVDRLPLYPRFFEEMYDQHWSAPWAEAEFASSYRDEIFSRVLTRLGELTQNRRGRLLDVGAHVGRFVFLAGEHGWLAEGVEPNARTAGFASQVKGLSVQHGTWQSYQPPSEGYAAITLLDVLEHLPEPVRVLQQLASWLKPGGWLVVKVPCGPSQLWKERWRGFWRGGATPDVANNMVHVNHFSPGSLQRALIQAGLVDISVQPGFPELPPDVGLKMCLTRGLRRVVYALACLPGGGASPLTLNLLAVARKPL
jgi:SAM-dependent methyltransferase